MSCSITQKGVLIDIIDNGAEKEYRFLNFDHIVASFKNDKIPSFAGKFY